MRLSHKLKRDPRRVNQQIQMFFANPHFKNAVYELREKWDLKSLGIKNLQKMHTLISKGKKISKTGLSEDIWKLMENFGRHSEWQDVIQRCIAGLTPQPHHDPDAPVLEVGMHEDADPINGQRLIYLRIFPSTTIDDMKRNWQKIKEWSAGAQKKKRIKISKKLDRDKEIFQLQKQGKTLEEIYIIIQKKYGDDLDFGHIKKIGSSLKKKIGPMPALEHKQKTTT